MKGSVRLLAALATLSLPGTYLAGQIDFVRRHSPGLAPERYWLPQVLRIWLPGLAATLIFALSAFALHRRARGD
jgi:phage tail protein X